MLRASRFSGWVEKTGVALAAVVALFAVAPAVVEAQERPTWPAFPSTIEAAREASYTQAMLDAVTCPASGSCDGTETGTGVGMRSSCFLRANGSANWCQIRFSDSRYIIRLSNENFTSDVGVQIFEDEVEPADDGERPPAGWVCNIDNQGDYGCQCSVSAPRGDAPGGELICTSPYSTQITDLNPGTAGDTVTSTENPDGTFSEDSTNADRNSCSLIGGNLGDCLMDIIGKLGASILWIFVSVLGALLGVFGMLFNWVVLVTVFQFATYFGNSEGLLVAWSVLRDLGNIFLLFGFIFIGLQTILNIGHFSVGKALPRLLIFALLINFSLLASSAIVDASNIFSAAFYTEAGNVNCGGTAETLENETVNRQCTGEGIAGKIMEAAGMTNIFGVSGFSSLAQVWGAESGFGMLLTYSGLLLLIIVMMIVFIAASIMLIIRAITLMFLLVLSPLGFAATAIPQFEEYSKMWWSKLISQAFFAPAFLLMLFVGLKIMEGASDTFNPTDASLVTAFAAGGTGAGGIFILFMLVIGFTIGSLMVASQLGAMGASFATRQAGGVVLGGMSFVGRRTGGLAAGKAAVAIGTNRKKVERYIGAGNTRALFGTMKKFTESSFDPRTGKPGTALKSVTGLDFGKPSKAASHGIHGIEEQERKKREEFAEGLKLDREQNAELKRIREAIEERSGTKDKAGKDREDMEKLDAEQTKDRKAAKEILDEQRRVTEAATGDQKRLEEARLGRMQSEYQTLIAEQGDVRKRLEREQKTQIAKLKEDEKKAKNAAKQSYVDDLNAPKFYPPFSIGTHVDHEAAEKIEKKIKQTDADKILAKLDKVEAASEKKDDHSGGGATPAAGGATH